MNAPPPEQFAHAYVRDPEGRLHLLGEIEQSADWTECRRRIRGVDGWRGARRQLDENVCAGCVAAYGFPGVVVVRADMASSLVVENNTFVSREPQ